MAASLRVLDRIEFFLSAAIMLIMVALYCSAIVVREFAPSYASQVAFVDEATRYFMVWMVFVALGLALARGRHIAMNVFQERMPEGVLRLLRKLIDLVGLGFALYVAWVGFDIAMRVTATGQISPTLGVSTGILYASMPVGFALLALRYGLSLFGLVDRWSASDEDASLEGH